MKIAVTGYDGTVGKELVARGCLPLVCDITNRDEVNDAVNDLQPDIIIHCAALTSVRECEKDTHKANMVNVKGTGNLALAFTGHLVYLSTDHVFSGVTGEYFEVDEIKPLNVYGNSKWAGEYIMTMSDCVPHVVRTSKLFSYDMVRGDLIRFSLGYGKTFTDLIKRSFMYVPHFADALMDYVNRYVAVSDRSPDVLNISGSKIVSYAKLWYDITKYFEFDTNLVGFRSYKIEDDPRPFNGGLNVGRAVGLGLPIKSYEDSFSELKMLFKSEGHMK